VEGIIAQRADVEAMGLVSRGACADVEACADGFVVRGTDEVAVPIDSDTLSFFPIGRGSIATWSSVSIFPPTSETQWSELGFRKGPKGPGRNIVRLVTAVATCVVLRGCVCGEGFGGISNLLVNEGVAPTKVGRINDKRTVGKETRMDLLVK
jgi:hypothetical protein